MREGRKKSHCVLRVATVVSVIVLNAEGVSRAVEFSASPEPSARERQAMLHLTNVSHAVNHFQNQMMTMLYPFIMADLGMTYTAVGVLSAISSVLNSICQGAYGFLTPFFSRCKLLGFGNLGI